MVKFINTENKIMSNETQVGGTFVVDATKTQEDTVHIINPDDPKIDPQKSIKTICEEIDNLTNFILTRYDIDLQGVSELMIARIYMYLGNDDARKLLSEAITWEPMTPPEKTDEQ
jgi:hypothetical protein